MTQAFRDIRARDEEICHLKELLAKRDSMIEENNKKFREHETIRRKLHNTIQELKVVCSQNKTGVVHKLKRWRRLIFQPYFVIKILVGYVNENLYLCK